MEFNRSMAPQRVSSLCELFGIDRSQKAVISLVGAGGKTTCMFSLAHELHSLGKRVAVTTTTHILRPDAVQGGALVTDTDLERIEKAFSRWGLVTVGSLAEARKLSAPPEEVMRYLHRTADFLLIEADGSRRLPIKAPRTGEPVIYSGTDRLVAVCGLSCLGKPVGRVCHRAFLAQELLGVDAEHPLTAQDAARLLFHSYRDSLRPVAFVLNQADSGFQREQAREVAAGLLELGAQRVAVTSFFKNYFAYYEGKGLRVDVGGDQRGR